MQSVGYLVKGAKRLTAMRSVNEEPNPDCEVCQDDSKVICLYRFNPEKATLGNFLDDI